MGATPQPPRNTPDGLIRWMKWVESKLSFILERLNNVLANTGLSIPSPGVTQVDGSLNVVGTENVSGNLNVSGNETVSGNLTVSGTLVLPNGSVNNAWLVSPVTPQAVYDSLTNFALTTTLTNIRTTLLTVPSGFTKASVTITVRVYAINPNTTGGYDTKGGDYLYSQANINGFNGYALPIAVSGSNGSGMNISSFSTVLTGLTGGGTISLQIAAAVNYATWAAQTQNTADVSGSVQWYR